MILTVAVFASGQTTAEGLGDYVDGLFSKYDSSTAGVALAVVQDGKIILKKGYGMANLEHGVPITPKTVFNAGSVSKQFTAFAIYLLERQGKLSLEDDVRKYVPEIPQTDKAVRIKHLLAHTSGIRDQLSLLTLAGGRMDDVITTPRILRLLSRQKHLNFEPGSRYLYGNSGYTLLAEIVQRVSGQSFAEFTRATIFEPLGMRDTRFCDDYGTIVKGRADSYAVENGVSRKVSLTDSAVGASNLHTTVEDMARWSVNFEKPLVGDADLIRRFNEPSLLDNGERAVYYADGDDIGYHAKGQVVRVYRGLKVLSHGGHTAGYRSTFWRFPDQRFALVLLSNDEHFAQLGNAEAVADHCLKDALQSKPSASPPAASPKAPVGNPNANLEDFAGTFYSEELDTAYRVRSRSGRLLISHLRHGEIELAEAGKDKFTGRIQFPVEIEFSRDGHGSVTEFRVSNFGAKNVKFAKVK